ncbi:MAG TPA: hypothetical protein VFH26_09120, partial [Gemmatimonadales bacterium]|nr:hypothetical protein [Gemmatimonadales bacterium]
MSQTFVPELEARHTKASGPVWLEPLRRAAMERFAATGFPTSKDEEWRFTPVGPIAQTAWQSAPPASGLSRARLTPFIFGHSEWNTLVFVNGFYREDLSSASQVETGLRVSSLAEALRWDSDLVEGHLGRHAPITTSAFIALNTSAISQGGFVHVAANAELTRPVHLVFVTTRDAAGSVIQPRNLVVV